jgi:hypothetical protein
VESVLRGIAHALNNRAAALSAVIELSREPVEDPSDTEAILTTEFKRTNDLVAVVRSLGAPRRGIEAFAPRDAAKEALAVLGMHAGRDRPVDIDAQQAPPIRVSRWMYVRALVALGAAATSITVSEDGEWLMTRASGGVPASLLVAELARLMGGEPLPDHAGFRVPTLAALRQREAR